MNERLEHRREILTIGHSDRSWSDFAQLLIENGVQRVADVRSYPSSRRHPQFNRENLHSGLLELGIQYQHLPELGGLRSSGLDPSPNTAWPEGGFRNYADHMLDADFCGGVSRLLGSSLSTVLMCAEADPNQCHRQLLSDYLTLIEGITVRHILAPGSVTEHVLHPRARVVRGQLVYPALQADLF